MIQVFTIYYVMAIVIMAIFVMCNKCVILNSSCTTFTRRKLVVPFQSELNDCFYSLVYTNVIVGYAVN